MHFVDGIGFLHIIIYTSPFRKENKSPIENNRKHSVEKNTNIVVLKDFYLGAKDVSGASDQPILRTVI